MMRPLVAAPLSIHHPQDWPALLSIRQVAGLLAVNYQTIHSMVLRGDLPGVRVAKLWRVAAEDVWPLVPASIRARWPPGPWES